MAPDHGAAEWGCVWGQIDTRCSDELASARAQISRIRERLISLLKGRPGELTERVSCGLATLQGCKHAQASVEHSLRL